MKLLIGTLFFILFGWASSSPVPDNDDSSEHGVIATGKNTNCTCGWANKETRRIVGGKEAGQHEYPMIAGIVYKQTQILFCGGTIITPRHIVSAGHCLQAFVDNPHQIGIHVGHHNYHKIKKQTKLKDVEKVIVYERYNKNQVKFDLGIMVLQDALVFDQKIGPACLPSHRLPLVGKKVRVIGWGLTTNKGKPSEVLLKVDVDVKPFDDCRFTNIYMEIFDKHQFCTFTLGKDSCSGDSGGPLMWVDPETNRYTLIGAVSYGSNCGRATAVNSEIGYFLPWIQKVVSETVPSMKTCANV